MNRLAAPFKRYRNSLQEFVKFGLIGGSGMLVNMAVFAACNNVAIHFFNSHEYDALISLGTGGYAVRNYVAYNVVAFVVAMVAPFSRLYPRLRRRPSGAVCGSYPICTFALGPTS